MEQFLELIAQRVKDLISKYVIIPVVTFMENAQWWLELIIVLAVLVLLIFGIIGLIKATWKFLLVVAVLAGIGVAVWLFFFKDGGKFQSVDLFYVIPSLIKVFIF